MNAGTHEITGLDKLLRGIRYYHARSANFYKLRTLGSESHYETKLSGRCENLWSVLRNLRDKQVLDTRYDTIMSFMKESFPSKTLLIEQTGRLMSQLEPEYLLAVELDDSGQTVMKRVNEIEDIQDLLEDYATGSLYMAEMIAPQSER
jgi:hypothetical protein